jgi:CPA2 family monovalent cation:H+ antiporter-2
VAHNLGLIMTLAGALAAALTLGLLTQRLRLSPIVGYLIAGILVGPHTPGFVADRHLAEQLSELGVVLLMFGVGMHFHARDLIAVRKVAIPGALVQILVATLLGMLLTRAFGWSLMAGFVFGLAISVASTVVLVRVLSDYDALHTPAGHVAVGWLIVEDIFTVLALVTLPILASSEGDAGGKGLLLGLGTAMLRVLAVVALTWAIGKWFAPKLLSTISKTKSRELFTLAVLVLALGTAVGSAMLFGVSMALGAFLAGMVVGQSEFSFRAASEALPMRDAFAVLFFVSVGMLVDPGELLELSPIILATLAVVVVGKSLAAFVVVRVLRHPVKTALTVAVALAQIGEFSFILAALARELRIVPNEAAQVLVATSIASITLNPLLFRFVEPAARRFPGGPTEPVGPKPEARDRNPEHRAVVIGYGPVGRTVVRVLGENGIASTVVELNHETVRELAKRGVSAVHGDAAQLSILEHAGVPSAATLVFAASGTPPEAVIRAARELNPDVRIFARSTYAHEVPASKKAGADIVVSAEVEVALALAEHLLVDLGATPEQLDRSRARARDELGEAAADATERTAVPTSSEA